MSARTCTKDTEFRFLCNCEDCSRTAAAAWHRTMGRVFAGDITLAEANAIADADPLIGGGA